ncbi:MBL fold metallo-hydrolase [Streptomyces sp. NPDC059255]|uniref:MBL fold metallo-hydrolase n=1 Tax=Streptomyces sp. NPDC059255 TaxID=3346793 RepID=UPI003691FC26
MKTPSWTIGNVHVGQVVESVTALPVDAVFPAGTPQKVDKHRDWLRPHFIDGDGQLLMTIRSILIESDGKKIVVDTCMGNEPPAAFAVGAVPGTQYLDDLAAAGFDRESVDYVLCTHLHVDHVGWNTMRTASGRQATFPHARYLFTEPAVAAWRDQDPTEIAAHGDREAIQPLLDAGLVDPVPLNHRITDSVRLISTPGHTRGHVSVLIDSEGQQALVTGDMTHHPVQWAETHWGQATDVDVTVSTATRRRILDDYADTDVLIIGTHYAGPAAGKLTRNNGGRFIPLAQ